MERITDKRARLDGFIPVSREEYKEIMRQEKPTTKQIYRRLLEIEDILGDEYDLDRRRELSQADRDGRCVVLPCKDWFDIAFGEQEHFWGIDTDYVENPMREISVDNAERFTWYDGWKTLALRGVDENGLDWEFAPEDIGKTVFLTREEAEAALRLRRFDEGGRA